MELSKVHELHDTDPKKELEGVEVHIGEGFHVRVARANNANWRAKIAQLKSADPAFALMAVIDKVPEADADRILIDAESATVLVGWRGLTRDGVEVPYSQAVAKELLSIPDFRDKIRAFSTTQELFRVQANVKAREVLGKA